MSVKAYFRVYSIELSDAGGEVGTVRLVADYKDKANVDWSKWTPSGEMKMYITNPDAFKQFKPGKKFYITFDEEDVS